MIEVREQTLPKVSVCVVTYNQEKYIAQCLQSVVDQKTDFEFEVIVSDDCSTDGTRDIIETFAKKYPCIAPVLREKNIGPVRNFFATHNMASGEYICHLDGDDYWLPGKLKIQANLLDSDPNCNIAFHRMLGMKPSGEIIEGAFLHLNNIAEIRFDRKAILQYIVIGGNSSKMYRKKCRSFELPNFYVVDYFANVEQVGNGYARFAGHENLGVYRMGIGIASSGIKTSKALADSFLYFAKKYPEYRCEVNTAALMRLIITFKNRHKSCSVYFMAWVKTFHARSIVNLLRNISFIKQMKPSA